jgi:hypothetical protein
MGASYAGLRATGLPSSAFRSGYGAAINVEQNIYDFGRTVAASRPRRRGAKKSRANAVFSLPMY